MTNSIPATAEIGPEAVPPSLADQITASLKAREDEQLEAARNEIEAQEVVRKLHDLRYGVTVIEGEDELDRFESDCLTIAVAEVHESVKSGSLTIQTTDIGLVIQARNRLVIQDVVEREAALASADIVLRLRASDELDNPIDARTLGIAHVEKDEPYAHRPDVPVFKYTAPHRLRNDINTTSELGVLDIRSAKVSPEDIDATYLNDILVPPAFIAGSNTITAYQIHLMKAHGRGNDEIDRFAEHAIIALDAVLPEDQRLATTEPELYGAIVESRANALLDTHLAKVIGQYDAFFVLKSDSQIQAMQTSVGQAIGQALSDLWETPGPVGDELVRLGFTRDEIFGLAIDRFTEIFDQGRQRIAEQEVALRTTLGDAANVAERARKQVQGEHIGDLLALLRFDRDNQEKFDL